MIFCDWINLIFDDYDGPVISGGLVQFIHPNGVIEKSIDRRLWLEGSHDSRISVRGWPGYLEISGNPTNFLQGHNLFGSGDLKPLLDKFVTRILRMIEIPANTTSKILDLLRFGNARVTQIHLTGMYDCGQTQAEVRQFMNSLTLFLFKDRQKESDRYDQTFYIGEKSRRIRTKIYNKWNQVVNSRKVSLKFHQGISDSLLSWCKNKVRVEFELKQLFLKDYQYTKNRGLKKVSKASVLLLNDLKYKTNFNSLSILKTWFEPGLLEGVYMELMKRKIKLPEDFTYNESNLVELPRSARGTFSVWQQGLDVKTHVPRATVYRHRQVIFDALGVDIFKPLVSLQQKSIVVPMFKVLEAGPASIPDWAYEYGLVA